MVLSLFVLMSWITVGVFFLIPKSLNKVENILLFFCFTIATLNIFTILELDLKLIHHSNKADFFISLWLQRNIIIPFSFLTLVNLYMLWKSRLKKYVAAIITAVVMLFIEFLTTTTGIKSYTGWNYYLTVLVIAITTVFYIILAKLVRKIPERKFR